MLIFLLAGTPSHRPVAFPERALAIVQVSPVQTVEHALEMTPILSARATAVGRTAWQRTASPLRRVATGFWNGMQHRISAGVDLLSLVNSCGSEVLRAIWRGDLVEAGRVLGEARQAQRDGHIHPQKRIDGKEERIRNPLRNGQ
jgi:hypothetical protein